MEMWNNQKQQISCYPLCQTYISYRLPLAAKHNDVQFLCSNFGLHEKIFLQDAFQDLYHFNKDIEI